jgi:hypothetical protein
MTTTMMTICLLVERRKMRLLMRNSTCQNPKQRNPQPLEEEASSDQEFSDKVAANVVLLIEGRWVLDVYHHNLIASFSFIFLLLSFHFYARSLLLSKLVARVCEKLEDCHKKRQWLTKAVNTKIKLFAKRKSYLTVSPVARSVDIFENKDEDRLWRWEFLILDLLPSEILP